MMLKKFAFCLMFVASASIANAQFGPSGPPNDVKTASSPNSNLQVVLPEGGTATVIDIGGIPTGGDDPVSDVVLVADVSGGTGDDVVVTGIGWDVTLDAFDPSWLSEATIDFNGAVALSVGVGDDVPGLGVPYSSGGILDLTMIDDGMGGTIDLSFLAPGGALSLTFFESFDDAAVAPDGMWLAGSELTVLTVPEPNAFALLAMAGISLFSLRRKLG